MVGSRIVSQRRRRDVTFSLEWSEIMSRLLILGATALSAGTCFARPSPRATTSRRSFARRRNFHRSFRACVGPPAISNANVPVDLIKGQGALINCAGHVSGGDTFTALVDRARHRRGRASRCGATGLLVSGRRGAPRSRSIRTPGRGPATGDIHLLAAPGQLRTLGPVTLGLALAVPRSTGRCAGAGTKPAAHLDRRSSSSSACSRRHTAPASVMPIFASLIPEMIVPFTDAAAVMLRISIAETRCRDVGLPGAA